MSDHASVWQMLLPFFTMVMGVLNLFIDPKNAKQRKWVYVIISLMVASFVFQVVLDARNAKASAESHDRLLEEVLVIQREAQLTPQRVVDLIRWGVPPEKLLELPLARIEEVEAAGSALRSVEKVILESGARTRVQYFRKDVDENRVSRALKEFGLEANAAEYQVVEGRSALKDIPTNALWAGENVTLEQARNIALILVRAGVELKFIGRFDQPSGAKANLVQIGSWTELLEKPALRVDQIVSLKEFMRSR